MEYDRADAEQLFMLDELRKILSTLANVSHTINYLDKPIKAEGALYKNSNDRYEINDIELSSGDSIEYLIANDCNHIPHWCASRIEHNGTDYYIVGAADLGKLEGIRVRIR